MSRNKYEHQMDNQDMWPGPDDAVKVSVWYDDNLYVQIHGQGVCEHSRETEGKHGDMAAQGCKKRTIRIIIHPQWQGSSKASMFNIFLQFYKNIQLWAALLH